MGIFNRNDRKALLDLASTGVASPWAGSNHLPSFVMPEVFGVDAADLPLSRGAAIQIPAVYRARNLIISSLSSVPLVALGKDASAVDGPLALQPSFLYRSDSDVTVYDRMAWTIDSLIFYGVALWAVKRGTNGQVLDAAWVPQDRWTITNGNILVDGQPVDASEVILFNPPFEGLLNIASRTIRGAKDIEESWVSRVRNPIPLTVLRETMGGANGNAPLEQEEITDLLQQWATARRNKDGALGFLPAGIEMEVLGEVNPQLFESGRNAIRTDIASFLNIPSYMLDGTLNASTTYNNGVDVRDRFFAEALPFWSDPIAARLSQDDVVPRGQRVRFDFTTTYAPEPAPTGPVTED